MSKLTRIDGGLAYFDDGTALAIPEKATVLFKVGKDAFPFLDGSYSVAVYREDTDKRQGYLLPVGERRAVCQMAFDNLARYGALVGSA